MSYEAVLTGLKERFESVSGIAAVLNYVPASIQTTPMLYSMLDSAEISRHGQVKAVHYRILHRLVFLWQDFEMSELEAIPFVDSIPAAVDADPHLGGRLVSGYAEITDIDAVWVTIAGVDYRALDFYSSVVEK